MSMTDDMVIVAKHQGKMESLNQVAMFLMNSDEDLTLNETKIFIVELLEWEIKNEPTT